MNEFRTLLENFWLCKDTDKETYYKVKRDIPNFQRFVREQLGWKLVHTENLLKLEKRPAPAEAFMGIGERYPITSEDMNSYYGRDRNNERVWAMTAFDDTGVVGHFTMRFPNDNSFDETWLGFVIVDDER